MRKILVCLLTLFAFTGTAAYAGSGHSHGPVTPISKTQALKNATGIVKSIVEKGKLAPSWGEVAPATGEKRQGKFGKEWVVTFNNPKVEDKAKQTLYVFLNLGGQYIAANYSGN